MSIRLKDGIAGNLSGNANTATTLQTARNIKIGNTSKSINGSGDVTWTLNEIGTAPASHTHSYLPLSGGRLTGHVETTKRLQFMDNTGTTWITNSSIGSDGEAGVSVMTNGGHEFIMDRGGNLTIPSQLWLYDYAWIKNRNATSHDSSYIQFVRQNGVHAARFTSGSNGLGLRLHLYDSAGTWSTHYIYQPDGLFSTVNLQVRGSSMEIGSEGNGSSWVGFNDTQSRKGWIGKGYGDSNTIAVCAENGDVQLDASTRYIYSKGHFCPHGDNSYYLGTTSPSRRWKQLCAITSSISTSDIRNKINVKPIVDNNNKTIREISLLNIEEPTEDQAKTNDYYEFMRDRFQPYSYDYKTEETESDEESDFSIEDKRKMARSIGFVANEYDLENDKVAKEFIFETEDGVLNYNTGNYTTIIAIALQEAIKKIEILEEKLGLQ